MLDLVRIRARTLLSAFIAAPGAADAIGEAVLAVGRPGQVLVCPA